MLLRIFPTVYCIHTLYYKERSSMICCNTLLEISPLFPMIVMRGITYTHVTYSSGSVMHRTNPPIIILKKKILSVSLIISRLYSFVGVSYYIII